MVGPQVVQDGPRGSGLGVCCNATTLYSICTVHKYCNISLRDESFLGCICMLVIMVLLAETNIFGGRTQFKKLKKLWIRATKLFDVTLKKLGFFLYELFCKTFIFVGKRHSKTLPCPVCDHINFKGKKNAAPVDTNRAGSGEWVFY